MKDVKAQAPKALCEFKSTGVSINLIVNRGSPPFDKRRYPAKRCRWRSTARCSTPSSTKAPATIGGAMLPGGRQANGRCRQDRLEKTRGIWSRCREEIVPRRAKLMEGLGYGPVEDPQGSRSQPATFRSTGIRPVLLIDQLKKIYIDGELGKCRYGPQWYTKIGKKDYQVGLNLTGIAVDDPDFQSGGELHLQVGRAITPNIATPRSTN